MPVAAAAAKSFQSCPTLCDLVDGSPPGSPIPGILQARILEWVAISFYNVWKWKVKVKSLSRVQLLATQWTAAYQASPSMGFARQEMYVKTSCHLCPESLLFISVQFSSVTQLCLTHCKPMNCSTPGLPVHHQLLEFTQTHDPYQDALYFVYTFYHYSGIICISEVADISPRKLDSSLGFIQPSISHDVLYI